MCRTDLPVLVGMGAVASCTFPEWRACGGLGRPWLWRRVCLVLWPSYLVGGVQRTTYPAEAVPYQRRRRHRGARRGCADKEDAREAGPRHLANAGKHPLPTSQNRQRPRPGPWNTSSSERTTTHTRRPRRRGARLRGAGTGTAKTVDLSDQATPMKYPLPTPERGQHAA